MTAECGIFRVLSPVPRSAGRSISPAPAIPDLNGKTVCAMRHTFRADETFALIGGLLKERWPGVRFIPNTEMPDARPATPEEETQLISALRKRGADAVLVGNGA